MTSVVIAVDRLRKLVADSGPGLAPYTDHRGFDQHDRLREDVRVLLDAVEDSRRAAPPAVANGDPFYFLGKELESSPWEDLTGVKGRGVFVSVALAIRAITAAANAVRNS